MKLQVEESDTPALARLKLVWLAPLWLVSLVPLTFYVGAVEYAWPSTKVFWRLLCTGRP